MKKTVLAVLVAVMAMSSGITAFAYWKSGLKLKTNIPVVYDVDIEVSCDVKGQEKVGVPDQGDITIRPDQGKKSSSESVKEESTPNESIQNNPDIEETVKKESITETKNNTESKAEADTDNEEIKR